MSYKIILREKNAPSNWIGNDVTKKSVLGHKELDSNFINLKGKLSEKVDVVNNDLVITKVDGSKITTDLTGIINDQDTYVTGGTYDNSTGLITFFDNDGNDFNVDLGTIDLNDTYITGGTYDNSTGVITFDNSDGGNFDLDISSLNLNDTFTTAATINDNYVVSFDTSDQLSAYTVDLSALGPAGIDTEVQFNDKGNFGAVSSFIFDANVVGTTNAGNSITGDTFTAGRRTGVAGVASVVVNGAFSPEVAETRNEASGFYSFASGKGTIASGDYSHSEGYNTEATQNSSHAEGASTIAQGNNSHSEGDATNAKGDGSHAEGQATLAEGKDSHAEGLSANARGRASHAGGSGVLQGQSLEAKGYASFNHSEIDNNFGGTGAEADRSVILGGLNHQIDSNATNSAIIGGQEITATTSGTTYVPNLNINYGPSTNNNINEVLVRDNNGDVLLRDADSITSIFTGNTSGSCIEDLYVSNIYGCSPITFHSELQHSGSTATTIFNTAFGYKTLASGQYSHAEGNSTEASGIYSHAEGWLTTASGNGSHAEGRSSTASGKHSHAEGRETSATGPSSHAEGNLTKANGDHSHAEGEDTNASGSFSHAEGRDTLASGDYSHAEGGFSEASGWYSHAEGSNTLASKDYSHAEGQASTASGEHSHAEGENTIASSFNSHAEGFDTKAESPNSHAEGQGTLASESDSHAEGNSTLTNGFYSHAEGNTTEARGDQSHSEGQLTKATGDADHAEGLRTEARGGESHSQNWYTKAIGNGSHSGGKGGYFNNADYKVTALGDASFNHSEIDGSYNGVGSDGTASAILGGSNHETLSDYSGIFGGTGNTVNTGSTASVILGGEGNITNSSFSAIEGGLNETRGDYSHAEGYNTIAGFYQEEIAESNFVSSGGTNTENSIGSREFNIDVNNLTQDICNEWQEYAENSSEAFDLVSDVCSVDIIIIAAECNEEQSIVTIHYEIAKQEISEECFFSTFTAITGNAQTIIQQGFNGLYAHSEGLNTVATGKTAHAEGKDNEANSDFSHAEGENNIVNGTHSHAEGESNTNNGTRSHIEGFNNTIQSGVDSSYVGGSANEIQQNITNSFIHGDNNRITNGAFHFVIGGGNIVSGDKISFIEGINNQINGGVLQYVEGVNNQIDDGELNHIEGQNNTIPFMSYSHIEGVQNSRYGGIAEYAHAQNLNVRVGGTASHAGGLGTVQTPVIANGDAAFNHSKTDNNRSVLGSQGNQAVILGGLNHETFGSSSGIFVGENHQIDSSATNSAIIGGQEITATTSGTIYVPNFNINYSPSTNNNISEVLVRDNNGDVLLRDADSITSIFTGNTSGSCIEDLYVSNIHGCSPITIHDEMQHSGSTATTIFNTAFGYKTLASGKYSHAEGLGNEASGKASHAEGGVDVFGNRKTTASGEGSHAEGSGTIASGSSSHAEGKITIASASEAHAEGFGTTASGNDAHAEGNGTIAEGGWSHAEGKGTTSSGNASHAGGDGVEALGNNSFNHSEVDNNFGGTGATADRSAILGGLNHQIDSNATNSAIIGGQEITATTSGTTYVPNLNIDSKPSNGTTSATTVLARNDNTGDVEELTQKQITNSSKYAETIPNASATTYTINHNLEDTDIIVQLWDDTNNEVIGGNIENRQLNSVDVSFDTDPNVDVRVVVKA